MKSSSLTALIKLGIKNPREFRDQLIHDWYIPETSVTLLSVFTQRKIKVLDLKERIKDGIFEMSRTPYYITWITPPGYLKSQDWALLSFRFSKHLSTGYVLIKKLQGMAEIAEYESNPKQQDKEEEYGNSN